MFYVIYYNLHTTYGNQKALGLPIPLKLGIVF